VLRYSSESHCFLVKHCENVFMMPFTIVLNTQLLNTKMGSSKPIIKSKGQKPTARYGFGHVFHNLKYFGFSFLIFLEFNINLRVSTNSTMENNLFYFILSYFSQTLDNICSVSPTCTPLAQSS
jgi:hypothetical protein